MNTIYNTFAKILSFYWIFPLETILMAPGS